MLGAGERGGRGGGCPGSPRAAVSRFVQTRRAAKADGKTAAADPHGGIDPACGSTYVRSNDGGVSRLRRGLACPPNSQQESRGDPVRPPDRVEGCGHIHQFLLHPRPSPIPFPFTSWSYRKKRIMSAATPRARSSVVGGRVGRGYGSRVGAETERARALPKGQRGARNRRGVGGGGNLPPSSTAVAWSTGSP